MTRTSYKSDHSKTISHCFKTSSILVQSKFRIFKSNFQRMASLDPSTVVLRDGLSPNVCCPYDSWPQSLSTHFETTWVPGWVWREGETVEPLKYHSTLCARGKAWTARAGDHRRKAWRIKRERKNHGREGRKRWTIKRERKNHGRERRKG